MQVEDSDRPTVRLQLTSDGIRVTWGPEGGPWMIVSLESPPQYVTIKKWRLCIGTKAQPSQSDDPDEPADYRWFNQLVGLTTEKSFTWKELPPKSHQVILARVIGYFEIQDKYGKPILDENKKLIEEGILSDVARVDISKSYTVGAV